MEIKNTYTITFTQEEIDFLFVIMGNIGGHPEKSYRKISSYFYYSLEKYTKNPEIFREKLKGLISFIDNEE